MSEKTFELRMPGSVYYECFDPMCTEFPRENPDIPKPTSRRYGRGLQFRYVVNRDQAERILEQAETFGEAMSFGVDDPSVGRRILRWVESERKLLRSWGVC